MRPELWQRINEILLHTWELDAGDRAAFLDQVCRGEPELRSKIESLLAADERIGDFLASPAIEVARAQAAAAKPYPSQSTDGGLETAPRIPPYRVAAGNRSRWDGNRIPGGAGGWRIPQARRH